MALQMSFLHGKQSFLENAQGLNLCLRGQMLKLWEDHVLRIEFGGTCDQRDSLVILIIELIACIFKSASQ